MDRPKRYYRISRDYCALRIYGMLNRKTVVSPAGFAYSDVSIFYILSERIFQVCPSHHSTYPRSAPGYPIWCGSLGQVVLHWIINNSRDKNYVSILRVLSYPELVSLCLCQLQSKPQLTLFTHTHLYVRHLYSKSTCYWKNEDHSSPSLIIKTTNHLIR